MGEPEKVRKWTFMNPPPPRVRSVDPADYNSDGFDSDGYDMLGHHRFDSEYYFSRPWYYYENNNLESDWTITDEDEPIGLAAVECWDYGKRDDLVGLILVENWDNEGEIYEDDEEQDELVMTENWDICSFDEDFDLDIPVRPSWVIEDGEEADDEDEGYGVPM